MVYVWRWIRRGRFMFSITLVHIGLGRVFTKRSSGAMVPPKEKKKQDLWESEPILFTIPRVIFFCSYFPFILPLLNAL